MGEENSRDEIQLRDAMSDELLDATLDEIKRLRVVLREIADRAQGQCSRQNDIPRGAWENFDYIARTAAEALQPHP